ncbi:hypothetical protein CASFOL_038720 [Castilleja foliolosa]|uniref:Uncharacterized protein n=1 Tax=Castilleja foliolosa TaxID=1961234 RepID=A0ABD3BMP0_9LAMI
MALSSLSKLCLLVTFMLLLLSFITTIYARELLDVGYSPQDLESTDGLNNLFESWIEKHGKTYNSVEEKLHRFEIFKDNLKHIDERNKNINDYWLGLNGLSDLSHEEFKNTRLGLTIDQSMIMSKYESTDQEFMYKDVKELPESVDWRNNGSVTQVKRQGKCGACWAFSAVAAVEGINQIKRGELISLSEQDLIDCDISNNHGCYGGDMVYAFAYINETNGISTENEYPYTEERGICKRNKAAGSKLVNINGFEYVPENDDESFLKALAHQPVSVGIDGYDRDFQLYKGGVFNGSCGTTLDHAVTAIGYEKDYIIMKNSWGADWGENGYMRMLRKIGSPEGLCGIYKFASYPIIIS